MGKALTHKKDTTLVQAQLNIQNKVLLSKGWQSIDLSLNIPAVWIENEQLE